MYLQNMLLISLLKSDWLIWKAVTEESRAAGTTVGAPVGRQHHSWQLDVPHHNASPHCIFPQCFSVTSALGMVRSSQSETAVGKCQKGVWSRPLFLKLILHFVFFPSFSFPFPFFPLPYALFLPFPLSWNCRDRNLPDYLPRLPPGISVLPTAGASVQC